MSIVDRVLRASWVVTAFGLLLVLLAVQLGFEQPVQRLVAVGTPMIFLPLMLIAGHLIVTSGLSRDEKRRWLRELVSWQAGEAFACYVQSTDRRTALRDLLERKRLALRNDQRGVPEKP